MTPCETNASIAPYPMTIAVMARDNAAPKTGMEYANTTIGDGGFVLKFGDGTVTNGSWKARCFSRGPIGGDRQNPRIENDPLPEDWFAVDFDDSGWGRAKEYSEQEIDPKRVPFIVRGPGVVKRLRERLERYLVAVDAQLPTVNPDFDPARPAEPARKEGDAGGPEKNQNPAAR